MSEVVIEVKDLWKQYRLGSAGTGSLRRDLQHWWLKLRGKEDPFFGEGSDASIWALRDVSFNINKGEALGIIGANGSGKSTLLKIISRIIEPTKGRVRGKGRVSSILEVGTGFHQELTGRENIYASGYTLGMNKEEIRRKFDDIVAFSGIEKFLDTPVKRYSSGMYVRLAFAVAAHLEPDILIIDEVLAVGDAAFQKKCLGKMQEVSSSEGRTIIFVSHHLQAVANLCTRALWLDKGVLQLDGAPADVIREYISGNSQDELHEWKGPEEAPGNHWFRLKKASVKAGSEGPDPYISVRTPVQLNFEFWCLQGGYSLNINLRLYTLTGECVFDMGSPSMLAEEGVIAMESMIPANLLNNSSYVVSLTLVKNYSLHLVEFNHCLRFDVEDVREGVSYYGTWPGIIRPPVESRLWLSAPKLSANKNILSS